MKPQKILAFSLLSVLSISTVFADVSVPVTQETITNLQDMVKRYGDTIMKLQIENVKLKDQIDLLNSKLGITTTPNLTTTGSITSSGVVIINTTSTGSVNNSGSSTTNTSTTGSISKPSDVEKYNILIEKINSMSGQIFNNLNVSSGSTIGLFEFIEPNSFFVSIDDLANPAGITAFKKKILYTYDKNYNLNITGIFDLDYNSQYYVTKYGKNPFARAVRIRVKNPNYKGKLLDISISTTTNTTKTTTSTTSKSTASTVDLSNVTLDTVKTAYSKNKILDALSLSTEYIKKDPNNIEVAQIRYRSFYILGKYSDALAEISKIETLQGDANVSKTILCDAKIISKLAKQTDLNKKYTDLCTNAK